MNENTDRLSDEAFAQQIIQAKRHIQTDAAFASELREKLMQPAPQPNQMPEKSAHPIIRFLGGIAAVMMLATVSILTVPPLRAIAQDILNLLIPAQTDEAILEMGSLTPAESQIFASVEDAERALAIDIATPQSLPTIERNKKDVPAQLLDVVYMPDTADITIHYGPPEELNASGLVISRGPDASNWYLWLNQTPSDIFYAAGGSLTGKSAEIETLTLLFKGESVAAQFARGSWNGGYIDKEDQEAFNAGESVMKNMTWINNERMQLAWEHEGTVYALHSVEEDGFGLTRESLIRIAESIE